MNYLVRGDTQRHTIAQFQNEIIKNVLNLRFIICSDLAIMEGASVDQGSHLW
jgi:hypothetical protein